MAEFVDVYRLLGVRADASQEQLKAAHRRLVRRHHPDLVPQERRAAATARVQDINVAYGLVRDPAARAEYDRLLRVYRAQQRLRDATARPREQAAQADAVLAQQWEQTVRAAGRWAGSWWRRNRSPLRRAAIRATLRLRRAGLDWFGRLLWLGSCVLWGVAGVAVVVASQRLLGSDTTISPAVGVVAGALVGSQRGWHRRLRYAGLQPQRAAAHTGLVLGAAAVAAALWVDATLL